jgi:hypothetical protein
MVERRDMLDGCCRSLLDTHIDPLSFTDSVTCPQCGHGPDSREKGGAMVGLQSQGAQRCIVREPVRVDHAAECFSHRIGAFVVPVWPSLTKGGDRGQDELGVELLEGFISYAEIFHCSRSEGLNNNICLCRQPFEEVSSFRLAEIKGHATFARVVKPKKQAAVTMGLMVKKRPNCTCRISPWWLDLDDVCTHITEQLGAKRAFEVGEIEDTEIGKCSWCLI